MENIQRIVYLKIMPLYYFLKSYSNDIESLMIPNELIEYFTEIEKDNDVYISVTYSPFPKKCNIQITCDMRSFANNTLAFGSNIHLVTEIIDKTESLMNFRSKINYEYEEFTILGDGLSKIVF